MTDYVKIFFRSLLIASILLQRSPAAEEPEVICGFPGTPANGNVKPEKDDYDIGEVVTYRCRVGYILLGIPIRRCTDNGSWSDDVPICDDSITTLGVASSTPTLPGHAADMAIDRDLDTCTYLKTKQTRWWRIELGEIRKVLTVALTMSSKDRMKFTVYVVEVDDQTQSYKRCVSFNGKFGSETLLFPCAEGKGLEGQVIHIEDHLHEGHFEICEVEVQVEKDTGYDCGLPDRKPFSMAHREQEDKVEYECETGYELIGHPERECVTEDGRWSGEAPSCKPIVCESLKPLANGELTYSVLNGDTPLEGSTVAYKCNYGYELSGHIIRRCLRDGSWSGKDPVCKMIRCPVPEGSFDGETYRLLNQSNRVGSVAKLYCRKGVMVGDPHITCTVEGKWTESKAQCLLQGGSTMQEEGTIVNRGGIIFGMAMAAIMMVIIMVSFYIVKRRRDANKPQLPSRQNEPLVPPPRPPPRAQVLKSALMDLVSRDSQGYKYESLNLENGDGGAAWKTRSLPLDSADDDHSAPRRTLSYDDPEKLASRGTDTDLKQEKAQRDNEQTSPGENKDASEKGSRVTTPVQGSGEYAAVDYDKKRQSRMLKEQDSEDRSQGTLSAADSEQLRELPPIPKEEEEEETRAQSAGVASVESEDVSLPIVPSDSQTSEAPTPSPDVVIENQVEGPSASPSTPPSEITPGRRRRRGVADQPSTEEVAEPRRTRTRRRAEPEEPESPPAAPAEEERPSRRAGAGRQDAAESPPAEEVRPGRRARAGRLSEPESPPAVPDEEERPRRPVRAGRTDEAESPPAVPDEDERPTRRTRPGAGSRFDAPTSRVEPSSRRRY